MLSLAVLSYRGFEDVGQGVFHVERLRQALRRGFRDLSPNPSEWDLAWGPVAYRAAFSAFDDSVVYVARRRAAVDQYVIAIRGTNPVSAFDWILGDFWSAQMLAWPHGAAPAEAQISLSTALGLSIIQHMRSPAPASDAVTHLWRRLESDLGHTLRDAAANLLRPIERSAGQAAAPARDRRAQRLGRDGEPTARPRGAGRRAAGARVGGRVALRRAPRPVSADQCGAPDRR